MFSTIVRSKSFWKRDADSDSLSEAQVDSGELGY